MAKGRVDIRALYAALDARRNTGGLSWRHLAEQADVSPSLLSRMANGQRPDVDGFVALVQWLGTPAETFMVQPGRPRATGVDGTPPHSPAQNPMTTRGDPMTDRHSGYVVTLAEDIRDDDAKALITALHMIKGVVSVTPIQADLDQQLAEQRRDQQWRRALLAMIDSGPTP